MCASCAPRWTLNRASARWNQITNEISKLFLFFFHCQLKCICLCFVSEGLPRFEWAPTTTWPQYTRHSAFPSTRQMFSFSQVFSLFARVHMRCVVVLRLVVHFSVNNNYDYVSVVYETSAACVKIAHHIGTFNKRTITHTAGPMLLSKWRQENGGKCVHEHMLALQIRRLFDFGTSAKQLSRCNYTVDENVCFTAENLYNAINCA